MNYNRLIELQNLEVDVDPKVWRSIEAELDRRRRRGLFFILCLTGLVLSASIFFINHQRGAKVSSETVELNSKVNIDNSKIELGKTYSNNYNKNLKVSETLTTNDFNNRNNKS